MLAEDSIEMGVVTQACNPSTWETRQEAQKLRVGDQPVLHETVSKHF